MKGKNIWSIKKTEILNMNDADLKTFIDDSLEYLMMVTLPTEREFTLMRMREYAEKIMNQRLEKNAMLSQYFRSRYKKTMLYAYRRLGKQVRAVNRKIESLFK